MGDMGKLFREMKVERQERHADYKTKNSAVLKKCGLDYRIANGGEAFLFRLPNRPPVDFYPSTGRWRNVDGGKRPTMSGGAIKFLVWYSDQEEL